jgi:hypothetical protein
MNAREAVFWASVDWDEADCRHWAPICFRQLAEEIQRFATDWALADQPATDGPGKAA